MILIAFTHFKEKSITLNNNSHLPTTTPQKSYPPICTTNRGNSSHVYLKSSHNPAKRMPAMTHQNCAQPLFQAQIFPEIHPLAFCTTTASTQKKHLNHVPRSLRRYGIADRKPHFISLRKKRLALSHYTHAQPLLSRTYNERDHTYTRAAACTASGRVARKREIKRERGRQREQASRQKKNIRLVWPGVARDIGMTSNRSRALCQHSASGTRVPERARQTQSERERASVTLISNQRVRASARQKILVYPPQTLASERFEFRCFCRLHARALAHRDEREKLRFDAGGAKEKAIISRRRGSEGW